MNDLQDNKILYLPMKFAVFTYIRSAYVSDLRKNESKRWLVETRSRDSPHPFTNDLFRHFWFGFVTFTFLTFFFSNEGELYSRTELIQSLPLKSMHKILTMATF